MPALMSGKVVPSSTEAGMMRTEASVHLKTSTAKGLPSAGITESNAQPVAEMNTAWKTIARSPIPSSAKA